MALSTSTNWISNFIIAFITPPLFSATGGGYYFLLLGFSLISLVFVFLVYRETAGKTLEQLGEVFGEGDVAIELQSGRGIRQRTSDEGSQENMTGKGIAAEPLGIFARDDDVESTSSTDSSGAVSVSDPLLSGGTHSKKMALVDVPLDDREQPSTTSRNLQTTQLSDDGLN
jgi:hypothetical protein